MAARIQVKGLVATVSDGRWSCEDSSLEDLLNSYHRSHRADRLEGPEINADRQSAEMMAEELDGEFLDADPAAPLPEDAVY
jgi:hypothetical protein